MSKEGKAVTVILSVFILIALIIPGNDAGFEETSAKLTKSAKLALAENKQNEETPLETEREKNLEIKGLKTLSTDIEIKNPFTSSHETRDSKPQEITPKKDDEEREIQDDKADISAIMQAVPVVSNTQREKPASNWKLTGVIAIGNNKTAILSRENDNKSISIGEVFDDKIITDIGEDYIIYADSDGQARLNLSP